jgi:L-ascorbate metabolism protein UlaG (beta-lactamase superfamily)
MLAPLAALGRVLGTTAAGAQEEDAMGETTGAVTFRWWGQACFSLTDSQGLTVLVDPFPKDFGYPSPTAEPKVVMVTHKHRDHNAVDNVVGSPTVIRGPGEHEAAGLKLRAVATKHDDQDGRLRGDNTIFVWEMAGIRAAHVGDLGHLLSDEQIAAIGRVDALMIPVGGYYTTDAAEAMQVARQLQARIVLPMHYKTAAKPDLPIAPLEDCLPAFPAEWKLERPETVTWTLRAAELPGEQVRVVVLKYE